VATSRVGGWRFSASIVLAALGLDLIVLKSQFDTAIASATCGERAKVELISCIAPPDWWSIVFVVALGLCLALVLGTLLGTHLFQSSSQ
jgi:hypothetical protein